MIKIYVHPLCPSSHRVVEHLVRIGAIDSVEILDTSRCPWIALEGGVVSVPWIEVDGKGVMTDPVEPREVEKLVRGEMEGLGPRDVEEALSYLKSGVASSSYAALHALISGGLHPMAKTEFAVVASRIRLSNIELGRFQKALNLLGGEVFREMRPRLLRNAAISFLVDLSLALRPSRGRLELSYVEDLEVEDVALWVLSKVSLGRSMLPLQGDVLTVARDILNLIRRRFEGYRRVVQRIYRLLDDQKYAAQVDKGCARDP